MIYNYGVKHWHEFPNPDVVAQTLGDDIAVIKENGTEYNYILTKELRCWTKISELASIAAAMVSIAAKEAEWEMVIDDFENGLGNREYPHCSKCGRGVYRHDAGSWCPFCGAAMKNPMR